MLAAVTAKYASATFERVETNADGFHEAHVLSAGQPL